MLKLPLFGAGGGTFLLDALGQAASAAFSVRRLSVSYRGAALNVRRSSDNTTLDIGFLSNGNLDTSAFSGFIGAGSGFVTKWYDQSGNGRDASQSTAAAQPQLVLNAVGGRPALSFVGTSSQTLATASFASSTSPQSWAVLAERTGAFTSGAGIVTSGSTANGLFFNSAVNSIFLGATGSFTATAADSVAHSIIGVNNGASSVLTVDGTDTTGNDGGDVVGSNPLDIGSDGAHFSTSYICETLMAVSVHYSASQRAVIHSNQHSYYGTA